jgi:hypothetical protein
VDIDIFLRDEPEIWADPPLICNPSTKEISLPTTEEIVLRLTYGWMIVSCETLGALSGFSRRTIQRTLSSLEKKNWIKSLGLPPSETQKVRREKLFTVGASPDVLPYDFKPNPNITRRNPTKPHRASTLVTTEKWEVPAHEHYVTETVAWLVKGLANAGHVGLAVPEQVLRRSYGWYSTKKDQKKRCFQTPVPDAWLIYGGFSLRVEVQISRTSDERLEAVCEGSPLKEPVLYVVDDEKMYRRLLPFLDKYDHFFLARLGNAKDLEEIKPRYQRLIKQSGFAPSGRRNHYSKPAFVYAVMNPEAAYRFGCQNPN